MGWVRRLPARVTAIVLLPVVLVVSISCDTSSTAPPGRSIPIAATGDPAVDSRQADRVPVVHAAGQHGRGRALAAYPAGDRTVAVTTTGVAIVDARGATVVHEFEPGAGAGTSAISQDGAQLVVWTRRPSVLHWFDLDSGVHVDSAPVPDEAFVTDLAVGLGRTRATIVSTPEGLLRFATPGDRFPTPVLAGSVAAGAGAVADGRYIVALSDTPDLGVVDESGARRVRLPFDVLRDVRASADGTRIGVVITTDTEDFTRADSVVVLDAASFEMIGRAQFDRRLNKSSWAIDAGAVVTTDGTRTLLHSMRGDDHDDALPVRPPVPLTFFGLGDRSLVQVHLVAGGVVGVGRSGTVTLVRNTGADVPLDLGGVALVHVEVDPTGRWMSAVDSYGRLRSWDLHLGTEILEESAFESGESSAVAIGPGGTLAVAASTGAVTVLGPDLAPTATIAVADRPVAIGAVSFAPTSDELAIGLQDRVGDTAFDDTVMMWSDRRQRFRIGGEADDVAGCAFFYSRVRFSPDGTLLAVGSHDFAVELVDAASGSIIHRFLPGPSAVLDVAFTADGAHLVIADALSTVTVWNVRSRERVAGYQAPPGGYHAIAALPDADGMWTMLVVVDVTGQLSVIDAFTGATIRSFDGSAARRTTIAVSPDASFVAAPRGLSDVGIWSLRSGALLTEFPAHHAEITDLAFEADSSALVTSSRDGTLRRWRLERSG